MAKIQIDGVSCVGEGISGILLDVHFMNRQTVILPLKGKARDPSFIALLLDERMFSSETDGERVYWRDGPNLSRVEILQMVRLDAG